jgi:hypothetical protein
LCKRLHLRQIALKRHVRSWRGRTWRMEGEVAPNPKLGRDDLQAANRVRQSETG